MVGCSKLGSSLWEEKNRQHHREGSPETPSVTGRRHVLLLPALCREMKKKGSGGRDCIIKVQICIPLRSDPFLGAGLRHNGSWLWPVQVLKGRQRVISNPSLPQRDTDSPSPDAQGLPFLQLPATESTTHSMMPLTHIFCLFLYQVSLKALGVWNTPKSLAAPDQRLYQVWIKRERVF